MKSLHTLPLALLLAAPGLAAEPARPAPPPVVPVVEDYFGTRITDNYRYMETPGDPVFGEWIRAEGRYVRAYFDSIQPRAALASRVAAFNAAFGLVRDYEAQGQNEFWLSRSAGSDNYDLMVRGPAGLRKLVDVAAIRAANGGRPFAINYFAASPDGTRVAVGISEGGSENASMSVFDVASGERIAGPLERIQFGPPIWSDDGRIIYANRLAAQPPGTSPTQRYLNSTAVAWDMRGEPVALIGGGTQSAIRPEPSQFSIVAPIPGAAVLPAQIFNGVQNEIEVWTAPAAAAATAATPWRRLITRDDEITSIEGHASTLYLLSHKNAPTFQVLAVEAGQPLSAARVVVPARPGRLIESIRTAADGVYILAREGLASRLFRLPYGGGELEAIPLPSSGSIDAASVFADPRRPGVAVAFESWTSPPAILSYDPAARRFVDRGLGSAPASFRVDAYAVTDLQATARDGMRVPFSVIRPAAARGRQPLLIMAYGSYGVSNFPYFSARAMTILNEGIGYAVCHVRGGGELGEAWRLGGKDANKANTWRDLIACAEEAVSRGLTSSDRLFIMGGSAGGIPMGMAPIERPDLFAGVIDQVPMASALRAEFQTNGPANIPEFGTIRDEQGFRNLLAMDGYQAVRDGVAYPPVLITTGLNDPRVDSWQPGKLAARMRAANPDNVVLLRVDEAAGHGIGSTKAQNDELYTDMIAFMNWRLGRPGWAPAQ